MSNTTPTDQQDALAEALNFWNDLPNPGTTAMGKEYLCIIIEAARAWHRHTTQETPQPAQELTGAEAAFQRRLQDREIYRALNAPEPIADQAENQTNLLNEIDHTLEYFYEEFPKENFSQVWSDPISSHAGGISPNDLLEMRAALTLLQSADVGWRPIETAPRDGTTIRGYNAKRKYRADVIFNGREWEEVDGLSKPKGIGFYPSHWMPLPPAPEQGGGK